MKHFAPTFSLPKWLPYVLVGFFVFLSEVPSATPPQKVPVQTEQRDGARSIRTLPYFVKSRQPVSQNSFLSEERGFPSLPYYSNAVEVRFKNRDDLVLRFASIGMNLVANILPRSGVDTLLSNRG